MRKKGNKGGGGGWKGCVSKTYYKKCRYVIRQSDVIKGIH